MGVLRGAPLGANSECWVSCCRKSGEAFRRNQEAPSGETASCAWVRARPRRVPPRRRLQLRQAQFHWGNPPSAAEPRILTRIPAYSSALAEELISQFRSISSCCGVTHSIGAPPASRHPAAPAQLARRAQYNVAPRCGKGFFSTAHSTRAIFPLREPAPAATGGTLGPILGTGRPPPILVAPRPRSAIPGGFFSALRRSLHPAVSLSKYLYQF